MAISAFASSTPASRDFAEARLIGPGDPHRAETEAFIAHVYRARYGAELRHFLPQLLAFRNAGGGLQAAVGLRCGGEGRLFVEQYLDTPAERAIATAVGHDVSRDTLVEVGNFGALSAGDSRALILELTHRLHAVGLRWVLFAATRQLRNAFDRLHLATVELADARVSRLSGDDNDWGRYYDTQPKLMFGDIAAGQAYLLRTGRTAQSDARPPLTHCRAVGS
ncbi:MAG: thermostable hemolysin [Lysobacteraceae bacterium]|nr:MAG: thermostable hemolysin [Xanthomonadaceae bacterium]